MLNELLSRDPQYVPVKDLAQYQQSLKATGYLPPSYVPEGQVDDAFLAADRRASRDAFNTARSGGSWLAAGPQTLFRYLGYTVPTSVFDGLYGMAKGILSDAARAVTNPVEVFEEGGLVGGAAVGAGIGAGIGLIGGPLAPITSTGGAIVGGIIGGAAGFFSDLFDDDEEEVEGGWQKILEAASPLDEIRSGEAKNLFAALSTIMSASAVLKAGAVAAQGVRSVSAVRGAQAAGGMVLPTVTAGARTLGIREGWRMAARSEVSPGILNQVAQAGLRHRTIGTSALAGTLNAGHELATTGDVGQALRDFGTGALIGAGASKLGRSLTGGARAAKGAQGLINVLDKAPLMRIAAAPAGKVATALYTGIATPTIVARGIGELSQTQVGVDEQGRPIYESGTAIGRGIEEEAVSEALGTAGTVIDWTVGAAVFPSRLLPWKGADVAAGMKGMASNHRLLPIAMFNRTKGTRTIGMRESMDEVVEVMGEGDVMKLGARSSDLYMQIAIENRAHQKVQERLASFPPPRDAFEARSRADHEARWLMEERSKIKAQVLQEAEQAGKTSDITSTTTGNLLLQEGLSVDPVVVVNFMRAKGFDISYWKGHQEATEYLNRRRSLLTEEEGFRYTPAVKDEYLVAQDYEEFHTAYESAATRYVEARKLLDDLAPEIPRKQFDQAVIDAGRGLDEVLLEMRRRNVIDEDIYNAVRPMGGEPQVSQKLLNYLSDNASWRPRRDDALTDEMAEIADGRYMAVRTGENMLDYTHFLDQAEIAGIAEYTRRQNFFDALSSIGARVDRADLGRMRYNSIVAHLDDALGDVAPGLDGNQAANDIYDFLKTRYDERALKRRYGKGAELKVKLGSIIQIETPQGKVKRELFKVDPRDLDAEDIVEALRLGEPGVLEEGLDVYEAADRIKRAMHVGAAFGADMAHPMATVRNLGAALRINGLPAFNDYVRTANFAPARFGAKGSDTARWKRGSYGYVPQHLRRIHMALQFSLSPTFDASRFAEAWMFGKFRGGDIPIRAAGLAPKKWVHDYEDGWRSVRTGQRISGQEAVQEMIEFGDRVLYKRAMHQNFDELQLRLLNRGILGFKPREVEYAQAWWLAQKKLKKGSLSQSDLEDIRETVMQIGQYGTKLTPFGNSAHFVFFPFLFSRKQVSAVVDFSLGASTRNLLLHEGIRRWYEVSGEDGLSLSDRFRNLVENHLPVLGWLGRLNNLAYGVSPGRFFLEGLADKQDVAKATQALSSFLAPGGVHTPIGSALGDVVTLAKQAFVPQVWTGDTIEAMGGTDRALAMIERLVPLYRDIDRFFIDEESGSRFGILGAQLQAFGGRGTARGQMSDYLDAKRVLGNTLDSVATASGYASWESMRSSIPQAAAAIDEIEGTLGAQFPAGMRLAQEFTNKEGIKEQTLYDIANKEGPLTKAEAAIDFIGNLEAQAYAVGAEAGVSQESVRHAIAPIVREYALGYVDDRQFMNLWDGLFRNYFGTLRTIKVA